MNLASIPRAVFRLLAVVVLWATLAPTAIGQSAYFSLEGEFNAPGDQHNFYFDLTRPVGSSEVLRFETLASSGGTNAAGDTILPGGIDSVLQLFDSGNTPHGSDDDGGSGVDSLLTWPKTTPDPLPVDSYRLNLHEFANDDPGDWALDLVGPADAMTLTAAVPTGTSTIDSLKFGTTGAGSASATLEVGSGSSLGGGSRLYVADSGSAEMTISGGAVSVGDEFRVWEDGTVHLSEGEIHTGSFIIEAGGTFTHDDGTLTVDGGTFDPGISTYSIGGADAADLPTVRLINGATAPLGVALVVGNEFQGALEIEGGSHVSDQDGWIGYYLSGDGTVTVSGTDSSGTLRSTWQNSAELLVGTEASGILLVEDGALVTSAAAAIGVASSGDGTVTVRGTDGLGNFSTWTNSGPLYVGGDDVAAGGTGQLTVLDGGVVDVGGILKLWDEGALRGNGNVSASVVVNGGTVSPGYSSIDTLTIDGDYTQTAAGTLVVDVFELVPGAGEADLLDVTGTVTLGGDLAINLAAPFLPDQSSMFTVLTAGDDLGGVLDNVADGKRLMTLGNEGSFLVSYDAATDAVVLSDFVVGVLGDYNGDGMVDAADYSVWRDALGQSVDPYDGADGDGSGTVDAADYDVWKASFGIIAPGAGAGAIAAVPEPTSGALFALAAVFLVLCPRRGER